MRQNFLLLVEIHSLLVTLCKITHYSLQSLLVTRRRKSLVTRCKIRSLLVAEVVRCKKSLVTRCKIGSLQKNTCYSLQKLLVAKNHSLLVAEVARCEKFLIRYEKSTGANVYLRPIKKGKFYLFILYFQLTKNWKRFCIQ